MHALLCGWALEQNVKLRGGLEDVKLSLPARLSRRFEEIVDNRDGFFFRFVVYFFFFSVQACFLPQILDPGTAGAPRLREILTFIRETAWPLLMKGLRRLPS